jgi:hypothetical protein
MSVDTRVTLEAAVTTDVANKTEISIPVVKFTWDGVNLSEEWSYISTAENAKRGENRKRTRDAFEVMGMASGGDMLLSFQTETSNLISNYRYKTSLDRHVGKLSVEQLKYFNLAVPFIANKMSTSLVMMVTGDGGSGKSFLCQSMCKFALSFYGKSDGKFPSVLVDKKNKSVRALTKLSISEDDLDKLKCHLASTKLIIIEDVQFLSLEELYQISCRLCSVSGLHNTAFGGFHTILVGDMYQPIATLVNGGTHVLQREIPHHNSKAIAAQKILLDQLTHFVDLVFPVEIPISETISAGCDDVTAESTRTDHPALVPAQSFKALLERAPLRDRYSELVRFMVMNTDSPDA